MEVLFFMFFGLIYLVLFAVAIAEYVLTALSLYGIAKKQDLKNTWRAWIPFANVWLVGDIADVFDEAKGLKKRWGKALLWFAIITLGSFVLFFAGIISVAIMSALYESVFFYNAVFDFTFVLSIIIFYVVYILAVLVGIAFTAIQLVCFYKLFENICPEKSLKYLVISLIVPLGLAFCLWKSKKIYCAENAILSEKTYACDACSHDEENI